MITTFHGIDDNYEQLKKWCQCTFTVWHDYENYHNVFIRKVDGAWLLVFLSRINVENKKKKKKKVLI